MQALGDDQAARPRAAHLIHARHPEHPPGLARDQRGEVGQLAARDVIPEPPVIKRASRQRRALGGWLPTRGITRAPEATEASSHGSGSRPCAASTARTC